jgi:hypothetical protein
MRPLAWHVILRLSDDRVLAPDVATRRLLARIVLRFGGPLGLLAFRAADTHLHALLLGSRPDVGRFAWLSELSYQARRHPGVPFDRPRFKPVLDQRHLEHAFRYILDQERHHGIDLDPFHDASSLPDLLGLRPLGSWLIPRVAGHLPRVRRRDLLTLLGRDELDGAGHLAHLPAAAAAAAALPHLRGRDDRSAAARRAAVHAAAGHTRAQIAGLLDLSLASVKRYRAESPDPALLPAVRRQVALRSPQIEGAAPPDGRFASPDRQPATAAVHEPVARRALQT